MTRLKTSMYWNIYLILIFVSASTAFGQSDAVKRDLAESFIRADIVQLDERAARLKFTAAGRDVDITLMPHDMRSANYRAENTGIDGNTRVERAPVNTFIGRLEGDTAAASRLNLVGGRFEGFFDTGGERYFIEPAGKYSRNAANGEYVVYRHEDALKQDDLSCGSHLLDRIERGSEMVLADGLPILTAMKNIELAVEADFEYVNTLGSVALANAEILSILNTVEGVYSSQLNLSISVAFQHTWTTPDPFAGAFPEIVVRNFQAYWNANYPHATTPRDAAHLFSGKSNVLGAGWAFIGVICNSPSFAYGMSGYVNFSPGRYLITAHELGHNLGGNHVDALQGCANSLMNAALTGSTPLNFCQISRAEIGAHVTANGSCLTSATACRFDFDGDAKADISIFRPAPGEWWYLRSSNGTNGAAQFGQTSDRIAPADFTGDGKTDIAFWRPSTGFWYILRSEDSSFYAFPFGASGDVPVPADYDADGKADAAIFRASALTWYIMRSVTGNTEITTFGGTGDLPVPADYDGDGSADVAIFRRLVSGGAEWWIRRSTTGQVFAAAFGNATDKTVPGDYTGDGKADIAIWRPSSGNWFVMRSEDSSFYAFPFGTIGDVPAPADFDGDGKFDAAVFRPAGSTWFVNRSTGGTLIQQFGIAGDQPVPSAYVR